MKICGLQKLSLLDYPNKLACTIFLGGCNYKCPFCHNYELIDLSNIEEIISEEELFKFLEKRVGLLDGVCITGGEPLINDLTQFIKRIKEMGFKVKLDTNGSYPLKLKQLLDLKLIDYIAMDIKNSIEKYNETIGLKEFNKESILESINIIMNSNIDYEFRTTVVSNYHNMDSFIGIAKLIKGAKKYYLQAFVDRETIIKKGLISPSDKELNEYMEYMSQYCEIVEIRG